MRTSEKVLIPIATKVLSAVRETPDGVTLTLDLRLGHSPGQFLQLSVVGIGEAPISIASWGGDTTTVHVREVGNVTRALAACRAGDTLYARGPYGNGFPMDATWRQSLVLVGGGCGVAPVRGVIQYILAHRGDYEDVVAFLGYRNPAELLFQAEIERWRRDIDLHISFDNMDGGCDFAATQGFVTDLVRQKEIPGGGSTAFLCGPPIMMTVASRVLMEKGMPEDRIWLSMERLMYCGLGECCHCMIGGKYTCVDGPVFRLDTIKEHIHE
ncbi:MAG: FAD/NAD(P)-binding protein [Dehalococcoidia bacterium]|nr:FAD/NAD(P)-binding protein [Dehalococcoidia bacterium]